MSLKSYVSIVQPNFKRNESRLTGLRARMQLWTLTKFKEVKLKLPLTFIKIVPLEVNNYWKCNL